MPKQPKEKTYIIYLFGDIDKEKAEHVIFGLDEAEESEEYTNILIKINSNGGTVSSTFAIYDTIKSCKKPVDTLAVGSCGSGANLVLSAGRKRMATKNSAFFQHMSVFSADDSNRLISLKNELELASKRERQLMEIYSENYGIEIEKFYEMLKEDLHLSASEAMKVGTKGWIDEII